MAQIAAVGSGGKHPQNAERDLQRTIQRFGKSAGIKIDHAKVRLFDPTSSSIYETDMPMLDPVALATAIWACGQEVFEAVFLGNEGPAGADSFWRNAKLHCSWFRDNKTPPENYRGLVPLSLYGDDVQAYRNSDPGAISLVAWTTDFGHSNEAMLQNFLTAVYSEYTACEHTYSDVLDYLLKRLDYMCDPQVNHPWHAAGFKFLLAGVRGDLKWLNAACKSRISDLLLQVANSKQHSIHTSQHFPMYV